MKKFALLVLSVLLCSCALFVGCNGIKPIPENPEIVMSTEERQFTSQFAIDFKLPGATCKSMVDDGNIDVVVTAFNENGEEALVEDGYLKPEGIGKYTVHYNATDGGTFALPAEEIVIEVTFLKEVPEKPVITLDTEKREFTAPEDGTFTLPTADCKSKIDGSHIAVDVKVEKDGKEVAVNNGKLENLVPGKYVVTYSAKEHAPLYTACDDVVVTLNVTARPVITLSTEDKKIETVVINTYKLPVASSTSAIDNSELEVIVTAVDAEGNNATIENGILTDIKVGTYTIKYNATDKGEFALSAREVTVEITFTEDKGAEFTAKENADALLKADSFADYRIPAFNEVATVNHPAFGWGLDDFAVTTTAEYTKNGGNSEVVAADAVRYYEAGVIAITYTFVPAQDETKSYTYTVNAVITDTTGLRNDMFSAREGRELPEIVNNQDGSVKFNNIPAWNGARIIKGSYVMNTFRNLKANEGMKITVKNEGTNTIKARFFLNNEANTTSQTVELLKGATGVVYFKNEALDYYKTANIDGENVTGYNVYGKDFVEFWVNDNATITVSVEFINEDNVAVNPLDDNNGAEIATSMSNSDANAPKVTFENGKYIVDALDGDKYIDFMNLGKFTTAIKCYYTDLDYANHMQQVVAIDVKMLESKKPEGTKYQNVVLFGAGSSANSIYNDYSRLQRVNQGDTRTIYIPIGLLTESGTEWFAPSSQVTGNYSFLKLNVDTAKVELSNFRILNFANIVPAKELTVKANEYVEYSIPSYDETFVNVKPHTSSVASLEFADKKDGVYAGLSLADALVGRIGFYKVTYNVENKDGTTDTAVLYVEARKGLMAEDFVCKDGYNLPTVEDKIIDGKNVVVSSNYDFVSSDWPGAKLPSSTGLMQKFFTLSADEGMKITIKNVDAAKDFKGIFYMTDDYVNSQRPWIKPGEEAILYFKNDGCYAQEITKLEYWVHAGYDGAFAITNIEVVKDSDYEVAMFDDAFGAEISELWNASATSGISSTYENGVYTITSTTGDEYLDLLSAGKYSEKLKRYFANASARQRRYQVLAIDFELVSGANEMWFGIGVGRNSVDCTRKQTISFGDKSGRTLYIPVSMLGTDEFWGGQAQQTEDAFTWVKLNLGVTTVKMSNIRVINFAGIEDIKSTDRETNEYENYEVPEYDAVFEDTNEHTSSVASIEYATTKDGVYQAVPFGTLTGRVGYYRVTYNVEYTSTGDKDVAILYVASHQGLRAAEFTQSEGYNLPEMTDSYENGKFYVTSKNYDFGSGDYPGAKLTLDSAVMKKFLTLSANEGMKITIKNVDAVKDFKAIFYMTSTGNTNNQIPWLKPGEEAVVYFKNDGCYESAVSCFEYWVYKGFDGAFSMNIEFVKDSDYEVMAFDNANGADISAKLNETKTGSVSVTYADGAYTATSTGGDDYLDFLALGAYSDVLKKYYATATPAQRMKQVFAIDIEYVSGANTIWMGLGVDKNNVDRTRAQSVKFGSINKRTLYIPIGMLGVDPSTWNGQGQQRTEDFGYVKLNLAGSVVKFSNIRILNFAINDTVAYANTNVNATYNVDYDALFLDNTTHTTAISRVEFAGANGVYNDIGVDAVLTGRNGTYRVTIDVENTTSNTVITKYVYVTAGFDTSKVYDDGGVKDTKTDANGRNYVTIGANAGWNTVHFYDEALVNEFNNASSDTVLIIEGTTTATNQVYMYIDGLQKADGSVAENAKYRCYVNSGERFAITLSRTYTKINGEIKLSIKQVVEGEVIIDNVRIEHANSATRAVEVFTADDETIANLNADDGNIKYDVTKNAENGGFDFTATSASDCYLNIWAEQYTQAKNAFNSEMPNNTQYKVISFDITNTSGTAGEMWMYYGYNGMNALDWMYDFYSAPIGAGETKTFFATYSMLDFQRLAEVGSFVPNYYKPCVSDLTSFTISNFKIYDFSKVL